MMDVIIFGGQSNMQGQSEALTDTAPIPNAYEYHYLCNQLTPLKNPVGEDITLQKTAGRRYEKEADLKEWLRDHIAGSACYGNTNLVPEFCRAYTGITGNKAAAVHIAKGSTGIADWLPGSPGYDFLVEKGNAALKLIRATDGVGHLYFVWLQGESDAISGKSKAYYKEKINDLRAALKADLGIEKFGVIRVGRFTNDERDLAIIGAQDEICRETDGFLMLTEIATELNEKPECMNPLVRGHYSAKGLEKLGAEAGKSLGLFVKCGRD